MSDTARRYRLYGLTLSAPLDLPCRRAPRRALIDVRLTEGTDALFARARARAGRLPRDWFHYRPLPDRSLYVRWSGSFEFLVSPDRRSIRYRPLAHATTESLAVYLLGQMLSFSLLARGSDPLHGTGVAVDRGALVIVGDCGYGKSTLAAALVARGCPLVTDDLVSLRRVGPRWLVDPGLPRVKLAPRVARRLLGTNARGEAMIHGTTKRIIPLAATQAMTRALPLTAIYVLDAPTRGGRIAVEPLARREGLLEIVRAAYNLVVLDRDRYANQFAFAARLAAAVPVRRLIYPRAIERLPAVCDAVLEDVAVLASR
ncbi:MAG TPA: hypothetical protein VFA27_06950 [Vicinamibacterales bacterium]|nr:hypothetical protein [Vicinamibacterales bacterium]